MFYIHSVPLGHTTYKKPKTITINLGRSFSSSVINPAFALRDIWHGRCTLFFSEDLTISHQN